MHIKKCLLLILLSSVGNGALSQDEEEPTKGFDKNKLFFGGTFGAGFGSSSTFVNVSPQVGYRFNRYFAAGTGINFIFSSYKYDYYVPPFKDEYGVAGLNIFGRLYPVNFLLVQAQPELNYTWGKRKFSDGSIEDQRLDPKFVPSLLVGAGAAIPLGGNGRSAMTVMYQYDVIQDPRSPYGSNAFLSIGFNF